MALGSDVDLTGSGSIPRRSSDERRLWPDFAESYANSSALWSGCGRRLNDTTVDGVAAFVWRTMGSPLTVDEADVLYAREIAAGVAPSLAPVITQVEPEHVRRHASEYGDWSAGLGAFMNLLSRAATGGELTEEEDDELTVLAGMPIVLISAGLPEEDRLAMEREMNAQSARLRAADPDRFRGALVRSRGFSLQPATVNEPATMNASPPAQSTRTARGPRARNRRRSTSVRRRAGPGRRADDDPEPEDVAARSQARR